MFLSSRYRDVFALLVPILMADTHFFKVLYCFDISMSFSSISVYNDIYEICKYANKRKQQQ
jgi:hypothetical protein